MALLTPDAPALWTSADEAELLALLAADQAYNCRKSLHAFVRAAWDELEPVEPFVDGWHIAAMCQHLEAWQRGQIRSLLINVPPRSTKSLILICFQAWNWLREPGARYLCASYSEMLSLYHAEVCLGLIQSEWYQKTFSPTWQIVGTRPARERFRNTAGGMRIATSVGARATGFGGGYLFGDDLHDINDALSTTRANINHATAWWQAVVTTRRNNPRTSRRVVVGQRVADDDVSGIILKQGLYDYLVILAEYELPGPGVPQSKTALNWGDPRTEPGALMCPAREGAEQYAEKKMELGFHWWAQYQQRPTSDQVALFRREDWQYYDLRPALDWFDIIIQSWDMAVKNEETSSFYAGQVWGKKGAQLVLLDRVWKRMDFPEGVAAVETMTAQWPLAYAKLIEDKGNGTPTMQVLRHKVFGLVPINPQGRGDKRQRAQAVVGLQRAHQVWLPSPTLCPWVEEYVENMARLQWDEIDATSQAWSELVTLSPAVDTVQQEALRVRGWQRKVREAVRRETRGVSVSRV